MSHKMHATGHRRKKIDKVVQNKNKKSTMKKILDKFYSNHKLNCGCMSNNNCDCPENYEVVV